MKPKSTLILCRQRTLHPIVLVLRKSAYVMENAKNASSITKRKANCPAAQDNRPKKSSIFSLLRNISNKLAIRFRFCQVGKVILPIVLFVNTIASIINSTVTARVKIMLSVKIMLNRS